MYKSEYIQPTSLLEYVSTLGSGPAVGIVVHNQISFHVSLYGEADSISATVLLYASNDPMAECDIDGCAKLLLATFSLSGTALGVGKSITSEVWPVSLPYRKYWAKITALSGTGAAVSLWASI